MRKQNSRESQWLANKSKLMVFTLNHASMINCPYFLRKWGNRHASWVNLEPETNRLCKSGSMMGNVCQSSLYSRLGSTDRHFWLWMLCTLPGFAWAKGEGTARANFRGFISFSVSHVKKGTLTLEVICVEEFLIMKGLWMLFRGGWVEPHQVFNCFLGVRLPWRSVISPDLFEKITYSYSFTKCTWPQGPWPIPNELSDWSEAVEQLTASSLSIFWFPEAPFIWHHHGKIREGGLGSWRSTGLGSHLWSLFSVMCRLCYCTLEIYLIL